MCDENDIGIMRLTGNLERVKPDHGICALYADAALCIDCNFGFHSMILPFCGICIYYIIIFNEFQPSYGNDVLLTGLYNIPKMYEAMKGTIDIFLICYIIQSMEVLTVYRGKGDSNGRFRASVFLNIMKGNRMV